MQPSIPWSSSVYVFVIESTTIIHSLKCAVPCPFVVPLLSHVVTHCHLLSLVVTRCITRCHFVTCCTTRCHSLSFVFTCSTRCHSLSLVVPLVVTCCTTRCHSLSFVVKRREVSALVKFYNTAVRLLEHSQGKECDGDHH